MPRIPDRSKYNIIRFALHGCTNRPFYHIVVCRNRHPRNGPYIEKLGVYDPIANKFGEKHVALDFDRFNYHLAKGAQMTKSFEKLIGFSGLLPIHPSTYVDAANFREGKEDTHENVTRKWKANVFEYFEEQKKHCDMLEANKDDS